MLDRNYTASFADYGQNADRIGAIGEVFPVIFFLVAALVCLTTMTRMVEEERTQIGTLKALGYGRGAIAAKYILYALLSSLLGSLARTCSRAENSAGSDYQRIQNPLSLSYAYSYAAEFSIFCNGYGSGGGVYDACGMGGML